MEGIVGYVKEFWCYFNCDGDIIGEFKWDSDVIWFMVISVLCRKRIFRGKDGNGEISFSSFGNWLL